MPKVTIWIRNEDYEQWQAIDDKPVWLHKHLDAHSSLLVTNMGNHDRAVGQFPDGEYGIKRTAPGYRFDNVGNVIEEPTIEPFEDNA